VDYIFELNAKQQEKLNDWLAERRVDQVQQQKRYILPDNPLYQIYKSNWEMGFPYTGAIDTSETFMFTPTSVGTIVKVKYMDLVLDLTEYENF
jgi:hypothetical protein